MGITMPTLPNKPRNPQRDMYLSSEGWYKGFSAFMICAITLFIVCMIALCVQLG